MLPHESPSGSTLPNARWVNQNIDVRKVADALQIRRTGKRWHCWNPDNHRNGDKDPSVAHWQAGNRLKCFVCDLPASGPINLAMRVLGIEFKPALLWISARFPGVPLVPTRKPTDKSEPCRLDGILDPITYLVRSHIYAKLAPSTRSVAAALLSFCECENSVYAGTVSYVALMRYSGVKSSASVRKAIEELEVIGWLNATSERTGLTKTTSRYVLTPFSDQVRQIGNSLAIEEQSAIQYERECAKIRKMDRDNLFRERESGIFASTIKAKSETSLQPLKRVVVPVHNGAARTRSA